MGTLVDLDTREMGIVAQAPAGADHTRPIVQILVPDRQEPYTRGRVVDLSEQDPRTGRYLRNIVGSRHPSDLGIQPAAFLLQ